MFFKHIFNFTKEIRPIARIVCNLNKYEFSTTGQITASKPEINLPPGLTWPKKPLSSYILFVKDNYHKLSDNISSFKAVLPKIAEAWKSADRTVYTAKYMESLETYKQEMRKIENSVSDDEFKQIKKSLHQRGLFNAKRLKQHRIKKQRRELEMPRRPSSVFYLYRLTLDRGEAPIKEFLKAASTNWKLLPEDEKNKFRELYTAKYAEYRKVKDEWCVKMIESGHSNLVPQRFVQKYNRQNTVEDGSVRKKADKAKIKIKTEKIEKS